LLLSFSFVLFIRHCLFSSVTLLHISCSLTISLSLRPATLYTSRCHSQFWPTPVRTVTLPVILQKCYPRLQNIRRAADGWHNCRTRQRCSSVRNPPTAPCR
jgi:hypothetical protein